MEVIYSAKSDREVGDGSWIGRKGVSFIGDTSSGAGEFSACEPGQMEGEMWRGKSGTAVLSWQGAALEAEQKKAQGR